MPPGASIDPKLRSELEAVYAVYAALVHRPGCSHGIGGQLVYVGELDRNGSHLVRAANIAGAASLSAVSDIPAQRQAIREGVIDFLVTSLDEALRILKNEVRKRSAVSVCVGAEPARMVAEMSERGVQPDLIRNGSDAECPAFVSRGAQVIETAVLPPEHRLIILPSPDDGTAERVLNLIPGTDRGTLRWLRLSSRYLGPRARGVRSVPCTASLARELGKWPELARSVDRSHYR